MLDGWMANVVQSVILSFFFFSLGVRYAPMIGRLKLRRTDKKRHDSREWPEYFYTMGDNQER